MDPEGNDVLARRRAAGSARRARAALRIRVHDDAITDLRATQGEVATELANVTDELVTEHDGRRRGVPGRDVDDLQIGAADTARLDLEEDLASGRRRIRPVLDLQPALTLEDGSSHPALLPRANDCAYLGP